MAEGFICGRGRGGKLGPLEPFVDGYGIENWTAEGSHASIGKTLKVSLPSGETQDSVISSKPISINGISKVQFMLFLQYESGPDRYSYGVVVYIKPEDGGDILATRTVNSNIGPSLVELEVPMHDASKKYIICIATEYVRSGGYCPTAEVSRVSLIPNGGYFG